MKNERPHRLVELCDAYSEATGLSHWRISALARANGKKKPGDGRFFSRLREGADCRTGTERSVLHWFAQNWPEDLPWPEGIQRPEVIKQCEDAA